MKAILASILGLALTTVLAAPARLEPRWCHPVCCCSGSCLAELCEDTSFPIGATQYCCHDDLSDTDPVDLTMQYVEQKCYVEIIDIPIAT